MTMKPDAKAKRFCVGTFYHEGRVTAYTRYYSESWPGCIEYFVSAVNGAEAKKIAVRLRKEHEARNMR